MSIRLVRARDMLATGALCEGVGVGAPVGHTPGDCGSHRTAVTNFSKQQEYGFCKGSEANRLLINHIND